MLNGTELLAAIESHRKLEAAYKAAMQAEQDAHRVFMKRFPRGLVDPQAENSPEGKNCRKALEGTISANKARSASIERMRDILGFCVPYPDDDYGDD